MIRHRCGIVRHMVSLTDSQLAVVMDMARTLPVEKRDLYLQRIAAMLTQRGRGHFTDADVTDVGEVGANRFGASTGGLRFLSRGRHRYVDSRVDA